MNKFFYFWLMGGLVLNGTSALANLTAYLVTQDITHVWLILINLGLMLMITKLM